ncbi:MAG TPA: hypothetical protein VG246_08765 [Acidimicrobiales bacterium]|jgi:hypothetical protein|nr:hypothetical protein [Acidimicrobiales bacterium]
MSRELDDTRRAMRLLRWYPIAWRERYGDEFVDHLGQEFADRPVDHRRSFNVAHKGLIARLGDYGLSNANATLGGQTRAALGTSIAVSALMVVIMLDFWSRAMLAWSQRRYHPIPVSATTGILTVAMGLLVAVLTLVILTVAVLVVRQVLLGRARRLIGPSVLALISGGLLLYVARDFPRLLISYIRFQGMPLSHPGQIMANLAQITWELTQQWVAPWNQGTPSMSIAQHVLNDSVPLAMFVLGVAVALLIRRVELPRACERLIVSIVALLGLFTGMFFVAYIAWSVFGGPSDFEYFFPESRWLGVTYLILLALVPLLVIRSGLLARRVQPRRQRNHIEIVSSMNESA